MARLAVFFSLVGTLKTGAEEPSLTKHQPKGGVHSIGVTQMLHSLWKNIQLILTSRIVLLTDKQKTKLPKAGSHHKYLKIRNCTELSIWEATQEAQLAQQNKKLESVFSSQSRTSPVRGKLTNSHEKACLLHQRRGQRLPHQGGRHPLAPVLRSLTFHTGTQPTGRALAKSPSEALNCTLTLTW